MQDFQNYAGDSLLFTIVNLTWRVGAGMYLGGGIYRGDLHDVNITIRVCGLVDNAVNRRSKSTWCMGGTETAHGFPLQRTDAMKSQRARDPAGGIGRL